MIRRLSDEKASDLAKEAIDLIEAGDSEVSQLWVVLKRCIDTKHREHPES